MVTYLLDFLSNYLKILDTFIGMTWTVMLSTESNIQLHTDVLPVAKVLDLRKFKLIKVNLYCPDNHYALLF